MKARLQALLQDQKKLNPLVGAFSALVRDSAVYLFGAVVLGLGNFVLVPLYVKALTPFEFGVYSLVDITVLIIVTISQLGFGVSYLKWFSELRFSRRGELLGSTLLTGIVTSGTAGAILAVGISSPLGGQWLETSRRGFAWTLLPIVILENVSAIMLTDLRAQRRSIAYSVSTFIRLLTIVAASVWFITVQGQGVYGIFVGRLVGDAFGCLALTIFSFQSTKLGFTWPIILPMIRYGLPLVWSALVGLMLDAAGRYFLNQYSSMEQVGYYGVSIKIANIFQMLITQPFGVAWGGLMFQIVKWPNAHMIYSKILLYLYSLTMVAAFVLTLFSPILFNLFATPAYYSAMAVFPLILLVRAVNIMEYPTAIGLYLSEKTRIFIPIYTAALAANIALNFLLVPKFGVVGAAFAWLTSWMIICISMAILGQRYYALHYDLVYFILPLLPWVVIFSGWLSSTPGQISNNWVARIILALVVIICTGWLIVRDFRSSGKQSKIEASSEQIDE